MEQVIPIRIGQDDIPEIDEQFQVELNNPMGGATLGTFNQSMSLVASLKPFKNMNFSCSCGYY